MSPYVVVFVTVSSTREGKRIAETLVRERLAACINVLRGLTSHYWWKGRVETSREELLMIKTRRSRFSALAKRVRALHSYTVPEIIALPVVSGQRDYLRWIDSSLNPTRRHSGESRNPI